MKPVTLAQLAVWGGGRLLQGDPAARVTIVSTDTRALAAGALFVPLAGETFDAHDFLPQAFALGATAALASRALAPETLATFGAIIHVPDTLRALQEIAARYRETLGDFQVVAVTGSNGKTSTKDFLCAVLAEQFPVRATKGNLNNHIGLPLSVLSVEEGDRVGVFELGMNHFGEIAPLAAIARPDVAVITNIGTAHIEFLGSREGIAEEKGRLVEAVGAGGCVVLNADDDMTSSLAARTSARVLTAGFSGGDVRAADVAGSRFHLVAETFGIPAGALSIELPVPGHHMIGNALLAATVGLHFGLRPAQIKAGLEHARLTSGRLQRRVVADVPVLDDTYNANPDSMIAALRTLAAEPCAGRRVAVLGRMGELGGHAAAGHREVGRAAREVAVDFLLTVGDDDSRLIHEAYDDPATSRHVATPQVAADFLREFTRASDLVLIKGCRAARMERVIALLEGEPVAGAAATH